MLHLDRLRRAVSTRDAALRERSPRAEGSIVAQLVASPSRPLVARSTQPPREAAPSLSAHGRSDPHSAAGVGGTGVSGVRAAAHLRPQPHAPKPGACGTCGSCGSCGVPSSAAVPASGSGSCSGSGSAAVQARRGPAWLGGAQAQRAGAAGACVSRPLARPSAPVRSAAAVSGRTALQR